MQQPPAGEAPHGYAPLACARVRASSLAFVLGVSGVAAVAPVASAAGPCDTPANPIVAENCLPGTPPSQWDVSGAGDASIQGFATQISVNRGETVHFKVEDRRDRVRHRHLSPRLLRRQRRALHRERQPDRDAPADATCVPERPDDRPDRLRELGRERGVGRARGRDLGRVPRQAAPHRHRGREPHRLHRPQRREPLGSPVPDLGHHLAGVQQLRRQQPLHRRTGGTRVQGQLQPPVQHP